MINVGSSRMDKKALGVGVISPGILYYYIVSFPSSIRYCSHVWSHQRNFMFSMKTLPSKSKSINLAVFCQRIFHRQQLQPWRLILVKNIILD